jgi:uncharacterized membrane protein YeaQ/YmgE (transglycosylase-associated protein family)
MVNSPFGLLVKKTTSGVLSRKRKSGGVMGIISLVILGLIVGLIAKLIVPGKDPGGFFITILLGIAGAFLGGVIGSAVGFGSVTGFNLRSLLLALVGSVLLLLIYRACRKR